MCFIKKLSSFVTHYNLKEIGRGKKNIGHFNSHKIFSHIVLESLISKQKMPVLILILLTDSKGERDC